MIQDYRLKFFTLLMLFALAGCSALIGPHSPTAYENATSLKAQVLVTLSKAKTPYADNETEVEKIKLDAEKAYEYVKGVPKNQLSTQQWVILKDPNGDLLGKFFKRWKERSTLSVILIEEYKKLASDAFDEIICLEANKKKATDCITKRGANND